MGGARDITSWWNIAQRGLDMGSATYNVLGMTGFGTEGAGDWRRSSAKANPSLIVAVKKIAKYRGPWFRGSRRQTHAETLRLSQSKNRSVLDCGPVVALPSPAPVGRNNGEMNPTKRHCLVRSFAHGIQPHQPACALVDDVSEEMRTNLESAIRGKGRDAKKLWGALGCGARRGTLKTLENIAQFMRWMPNEVTRF